MDDKKITKALHKLLKNDREQQEQIAVLTEIVTVLRAGATPEQERKIEAFLRKRTVPVVEALPSDDEKSETLDQMLRELDQWAADEG